MKDYNIEDLWLQDVAPESSFKLDVLPSSVTSKFSVFRELKRDRNLFWWQWSMEIIGILFAGFQFMFHGESITIGNAVIAMLTSAIPYCFYISYFRRFIKSINDNKSQNMKDSLQSFLDSLNKYIKNVIRLFVIILIFNIALYVLVSIIDFESIGRLVADLITAVLAFVITYASIAGWFDFMYKDSVTELENAIRYLE
ncbi:MAG: hypothetical protein HKO66_12700 [Saprospiraceae bacterium]|nr:hypothetical protein [Saprospiraceae bacterium]